MSEISVFGGPGRSPLYEFADEPGLLDRAAAQVAREHEIARAVSTPPGPPSTGRAGLDSPEQATWPPPSQSGGRLLTFQEFAAKVLPEQPPWVPQGRVVAGTTQRIQAAYENYLAVQQAKRKSVVDEREYELKKERLRTKVVERYKTLEEAAVADIKAGQGDTEIVRIWKQIKKLPQAGALPESEEKTKNDLRQAAVAEIQAGKPGPAVDAYLLVADPGAYERRTRPQTEAGDRKSLLTEKRLDKELFGDEEVVAGVTMGTPGVMARIESQDVGERVGGWLELHRQYRSRRSLMTGIEGEAQRRALANLLEEHKPTVEDVIAAGPPVYSELTGVWHGDPDSSLSAEDVEELLRAVLSQEQVEKIYRGYHERAARPAKKREAAEQGDELERLIRGGIH